MGIVKGILICLVLGYFALVLVALLLSNLMTYPAPGRAIPMMTVFSRFPRWSATS